VTLARNEHQMDRPSHGGAPCGARSVYAPVARDKAQGRPHVRPVCVASSLLAGSTRYLPVRTGGASRPVPFILVTLRPPSTVERHRRLVSFLPMGRAATNFCGAIRSGRRTLNTGHHVLQDNADVPECHSSNASQVRWFNANRHRTGEDESCSQNPVMRFSQ
jgi:hypothetical protein